MGEDDQLRIRMRGVLLMFDAMRSRIAEIKTASARVAPACVAPLRSIVVENARTRRGNVPLYVGPLSDVEIPITVTASGNAITIRAVDWSMRQMVSKGSPVEWITVVSLVARDIVGGR